uniref:Uncharacterized protein n=1 Tax=Anopheles funestus TaxID=62324 RepID=A0A4Y0BGL0_ANOFN
MHLRSLYWILAAAVLLVVTSVLTASVPNGDVYYENTLSENGRFFANHTEYGIYYEEQGILHPSSGSITVTALIRSEGTPDRTYEYRLIPDGDGYRLDEPSHLHIPWAIYIPPVPIEPKLILSLLGGGKF